MDEAASSGDSRRWKLSLTPGFSQVTQGRVGSSRFNGFAFRMKTVETVSGTHARQSPG
jgi:hypothetical protein